MILSFAKALKCENINYQQQLLVIATDLSDICAYMTYIQLSLYGIPAIVYCGNTLTLESNFKMETPLYFLQYWKFRKSHLLNDEQDLEHIEENQDRIKKENLFNEITVNGNCQITLW